MSEINLSPILIGTNKQMESSEPKSRRRKIRIKKTKFKEIDPGFFTRTLGRIFGPVYLENHRPINIGVILVFGLVAAFILLLTISPSTINKKLTPVAPVSVTHDF